jgi:hypothetical protein|tara:strand:- start:4403 stop:5233 length:831 start_codon:yes stop_codon:yes gene_type:complete
MNKYTVLLGLAAMSSALSFAQQDHSAAPMIAPQQTAMSEDQYAASLEEPGRQESEALILERFREAFPNKPRMAVLWNSEFPNRVSDWYNQRRGSLGVTGELSVTGSKDAREERGRASATGQVEHRGSATTHSERDNTALNLQSGLIDSFRSAGATVIDQSMARRITDNELESGTFERASPDQLRLQMRALAKHADYVLELIIGNNYIHDGLYQIRVLSVKDASILATFSTEARPPDSEVESAWVVSGSGFDKRERAVPAETIGREIALRTMIKMSQ